MTETHIIEIQPSESGDEWTWNIQGTTLFHAFEDAEAAEQGALDELGSGQVSGFLYPQEGDGNIHPVVGWPVLSALSEQEKRIWAAGRRIYKLPAAFRLLHSMRVKALTDGLDNALTSNIVYGDFQMADGYLTTLEARLEAAERSAA